MIRIFLIVACVLASLPAFVPERRWFYADIFLFSLAEAGLVFAVLNEFKSPIVDSSPNALLLPIVPIIPAALLVIALIFRMTAYLIRNIPLRRNHKQSAH
jgi:hypothetical protein